MCQCPPCSTFILRFHIFVTSRMTYLQVVGKHIIFTGNDSVARIVFTLWDCACVCVYSAKCGAGDTNYMGNNTKMVLSASSGVYTLFVCLWTDFLNIRVSQQSHQNKGWGQQWVWSENLLALWLVWSHHKRISGSFFKLKQILKCLF